MALISHPTIDSKDNITTSDDPISPASSVRSADLDEAYLLYKKAEEDALELDPLEAKRVLRKIDRRIVPILFLIYWLQYLDKNGLNYASAYGLQTDLKMVGDDFSWLGSIFYFGMSDRIAGQESMISILTASKAILLPSIRQDISCSACQ